MSGPVELLALAPWLRRLLGVEEQDIPAGATTRFEFANLPGGSAGLLLLLAALAVVLGVFWIYRREGAARPGVKRTLAILRCLFLLCGFLLILEPVLAISQVDEVTKSTVVLLDGSLSMSARDRYTDPVVRARLQNATGLTDPPSKKRYQLLNAALATSELGAKLAAQNEVVVFRFADVVEPHARLARVEPPAEGEIAAPVEALPILDPESRANRKRAARGTNLAGSIRQVVDQVGSDRIAAIVLVSDGRSNLGPPAEDVALYLKNKDIVLHTVCVGEATEPRNLAALALAGPDRAFRNDPIVLDARLAARGFGSGSVRLERRYADGADSWEKVGTPQTATFESKAPVALKFTDRPPRVGTVIYRLTIERRRDEATYKDNVREFTTQVVEEKAKVLLVAGAPTHEYYAIKNVLLRDRTITLACFLQSADPQFPQDGNGVSLKELPKNEKELFEFGVVLLADPNPNRFPVGWRALLRKFTAEHGGGLGFVAGNKFTLDLLRSGEGDDDIAGVLPVVLDLDTADEPRTGIGFARYFKNPWRMVPDPSAFGHPTTRFHSDPRRARALVWDRLPPFFWFFPVKRPKPGAVVLAHHEDPRQAVEGYGPRPILAVHRYGRGNVMFLAADETHRWRDTAENVFDRFWVQTARFLLEGRHAGERKRFRIYLDREILDLGDSAQVNAEAFDENYEPFEGDEVHVRIVRAVSEEGETGSDEKVRLLPVEGKPGYYSASYSPDAVGDYELFAGDALFAAKDPKKRTAQAALKVALPDREMGDVRADASLLKRLATGTRGIGVTLADMSRLCDPTVVPPARERVVTQGRPVPLWDTWTTIALMLTLLCAEWILRKRYRMV